MDCKNVDSSTRASTSRILIAIPSNIVKASLGHSSDKRKRPMCSFSSTVFIPTVPATKDKLKCRRGNNFQTKFYFCCNKHQGVINHPGGCSKPHFLFLSVRVSFISTSGHITAGNYKVLINSETGEIRVIRARTFISNHRFTF